MNHRANSSLKTSAVALLALALAAAPAVGVPPFEGTRQPTASQGAAAALKAADAQLKFANDAKARARLRIEVAMRSARPEWQTAQKAHDKAASDLATATRATESKLRTRPDYKTLSAAKEATDVKYRQLSEDPAGKEAELDAVYRERTKYVLALRKMEADALANDPKVIDAKARLAEAKAKVDSFKSEVEAAALSDPEYVASLQQVTAAEQQVQAARLALAEARKADSAARVAAAKARAEAAKAKTKSGTSGGPTGY